MAGTYGEPGKNPFQLKGISGILSPVVNAETGVTQVYKQGAGNTYQSLGTLDPKTNKFAQDKTNAPNLTEAEIKALSSTEGINNIKNAAKTATIKGVKAEGKTDAEAQAKANKLTSPNSADKPPGETAQTISKEELEESIKSKERSNYDPLIKYPITLNDNFQDYIKFQMINYLPRGLGSGNNLGVINPRERIDTSPKPNSGSSNTTRNILGSVLLPIPGNISDSNTVSWGDARIDPLTEALTTAAVGGIKGDLTETIERAKKTTKDVSSMKAVVLGTFTQLATGINPLTRLYGVVANPNLELLFNGPDLRNFTFTFRLSPRDANEAVAIRKIIRFFKQGMSVKRTEGELFLGSPHTFQISYWNTKTREHPYLNKFKECALKSFSVNYAPDGTYMTFNHKNEPSMTAYDITMQFTELEPVFDDDYTNLDKNDDTTVGY